MLSKSLRQFDVDYWNTHSKVIDPLEALIMASSMCVSGACTGCPFFSRKCQITLIRVAATTAYEQGALPLEVTEDANFKAMVECGGKQCAQCSSQDFRSVGCTPWRQSFVKSMHNKINVDFMMANLLSINE